MKNIIFLSAVALSVSFCGSGSMQMESAGAPEQQMLTEAEYLIEAKIISDTEYLIVCKAYPKPGLTDDIQKSGTAKEAALLYAQLTAQKRLVNINPTGGTVKEYTFNGKYGIVHYVIESVNIRACVK